MIFGMRIATQMPQHPGYLNASLYSPRCIEKKKKKSHTSLGKCNFPGVACSIVSIIYLVADGGHLNCDAVCAFVSANC